MTQPAQQTSGVRALFDTLNQIDRPGSFCMQGSMPLVLPGLEVKGVGPIGLPLSAKQAKDLIQWCEQAPYGKGEETRVDTSVRRVWQLEPEQFNLANRAWPSFVDTVTELVRKELGLESQKLKSRLYKLLVYEKGSFFVAHRDTEKIDRMVATLLIVLPSAHEGGELVVRHEGDERVIDFGGKGREYEVHYAAFYADCQHEVRPVRKGYRLCLAYNLALVGRKTPLAAPATRVFVDQFARDLREWQRQASSIKLAVVLDHEYTAKSLAFGTLKGLDRAKAQVVSEAARKADCEVHLALLTLWESGYPEYTGYAEDQYEMAEVFESRLAADHWTDTNGRCVPFGAIEFDPDEIVCDGELRDVDPEDDYQEYTGNEGATLERWYRHAALVLWPTERHFQVLCEAGTEHAVATLALMTGALKEAKSNRNGSARERCVEFAKAIIRTWPDLPWSPYRSRSEPSGCQHLVAALKALNEASLTHALLREVLPKDDSPVVAADVVTLCKPLGWADVRNDLVHLIANTGKSALERNARILEALCLSRDTAKIRVALCRGLASRMVEAVVRCDTQRSSDRGYEPKVDRVSLLESLCKSCMVAGEHKALDKLVGHLTSRPKTYPRTQVQIVALQKLRPWLRKNRGGGHVSLRTWIERCIGQLEKATAKAPKAPSHWRQNVKLSCTCTDCVELSHFLQDPTEQEHRFRVRKDRRHHLHQTIERHRGDLTHVTDRRGSPQTLVCTKTRASHQAKVRQYHLDVKHLAEMRALRDEL